MSIKKQKARDTLGCQLRDKEVAMRQAHNELTAGHRNLKKLYHKAKKIDGKLLIARANVSFSTTLREKCRDQLDGKAAELR